MRMTIFTIGAILTLGWAGPGAAQTEADALLRGYVGRWETVRTMCAKDEQSRTLGRGLDFGRNELSFIEYAGEGGGCDTFEVRRGKPGIVLSGPCGWEEHREGSWQISYRLAGPGVLIEVIRSDAGEVLGRNTYFRCSRAAPRSSGLPSARDRHRHCTIVDRTGAITDLETCAILQRACPKADRTCITVVWPSGARTVVEATSSTVASGTKVNGQPARPAAHDWLPKDADCIANSASGNTLCLTTGPFPPR